jgi:succinate dehydrogenase / fumarate reductase cytochrome b subunit
VFRRPTPCDHEEFTDVTSVAPAPAKPRSKPAGTLYRGRTGMWSWVAHRITGVLTFFFLFAHVLDTALVRVSPESYDEVIDTYKNPFVNLMEIGLVGAVLFHALNGLRVIAVDFWAKGTRYQRQILWAIVLVWVIVMVPGAFFMFKHSWEHLFGSAT